MIQSPCLVKPIDRASAVTWVQKIGFLVSGIKDPNKIYYGSVFHCGSKKVIFGALLFVFWPLGGYKDPRKPQFPVFPYYFFDLMPPHAKYSRNLNLHHLGQFSIGVATLTATD